jgi:hypothetical protein
MPIIGQTVVQELLVAGDIPDSVGNDFKGNEDARKVLLMLKLFLSHEANNNVVRNVL